MKASMRFSTKFSTKERARLLGTLILAVTVSGCGGGAGGASESSPSTSNTISGTSGSSTDGSSNGSSSSSTPSSNGAGSAACIDASGVSHADGSSWAESLTGSAKYTCTGSDNAPYKVNTSTYYCKNGITHAIGQKIGPYVSDVVLSCAVPTLQATITPSLPSVGSVVSLQIISSNVSSVSYACSESESGRAITSGSVPSGSQSVNVTATADLRCQVTSTNLDGSQLQVVVETEVNCGNKVRVGGHCEDVGCSSVQTITADASGVVQVPARTSAGVCYAMKLMDRIANSSSSLTSTVDSEVVSRNHDINAGDPNETHHPYMMGRALVNFNLAGARVVKIAGAADSVSPVLVDNFVLGGIYPMGTTSPDASMYAAFGTSDSTVGATGGVLLKNQVVPLVAFGTGGTSTVAPLDVSAAVSVGSPFTLDLRALDCGGARELSDIYLVFQ